MKTTLTYSNDARIALERFLEFWPLVSRARQQEKIDCAAEAHLRRQCAQEVNRDILISALLDSHPSFETFTLALRDPVRIQAVVTAQQNIDTRNPLGRVIRWDAPVVPINRPVRDVFALLTGPRINGNTDCILEAVLDGMRECGCNVEKACFSRLKITPCTGCLKCQDEKPETYCAVRDDMVPIYKRLLECDAFVLGFPIYSARESAQTTVFFDRLKALSNPWVPFKPEPKKGALVSTWGWPSAYLYRDVVHTIAFLIRHFGVETAEVVTGSGFWGSYYEKGSAKLDTHGMEQARAAGRALCSADR